MIFIILKKLKLDNRFYTANFVNKNHNYYYEHRDLKRTLGTRRFNLSPYTISIALFDGRPRAKRLTQTSADPDGHDNDYVHFAQCPLNQSLWNGHR